MAEDRIYIQYPFRTPKMNQSVPPNQVAPGTFGRLSGVDGRFGGCLHKFYGMREVLDLDDVSGMGDIDAYAGPDFIKRVTFQKRGTTTIYQGFVVRWDSQNDTTNEQIDLIYTGDNGSTWTKLAIWAAENGITASLGIDCAVSGAYLMVAVDTKATKTVYWSGSALVAVDSGPGAFSATLATPTFSTSAVDTDYYLNGTGTFQVAWRFYSSTRGIYSALSTPLTVSLDHHKKTKATGTISFTTAGGDFGLMIEGDIFTINGRTYEYISDSGSDVIISVATAATVAAHTIALADAINGDASADVTATAYASSVLLEAILRGTDGNAYTLSVSEVDPNTDDISVSGSTLTGGGEETTEPETQVKITIDLPDHDAVVAEYDYDDFAALFDTVDIFRTINLGNTGTTQGAIFYLEQTIAKIGNWANSTAWDALQVNVGTVLDEALPYLTMYDPEKDIVSSPPQSGTIARYGKMTFMGQALSSDGGYDTLWSSPEHASPEYFTTYSKRIGDPEDGRPLRLIPAGDSLFQLCYNSIIHIYKSSNANYSGLLQFTRLHSKRGIAGKEAAHSSGNSIFMVSGFGLCVLNAKDGSLGSLSAVDWTIYGDWKSDLANVKSCYDAVLNASFFLNPTQEEMIVLWHSPVVCTILDGANFVGATSGPDIAGGKNDRAFFITATGLIVSPDTLEAGSGTMWDLSSDYTLNGTATATSDTTLTDDNAALNADMEGSKLYMTTGANAGQGRTIDTIDNTTKVITFVTTFDNDISTGDTYSISPIPFSVRAWALQNEQVSRFNRWIMAGVSIKARELSGFDNNVNNKWRVGAYRNSGSSIESDVAYPTVDTDPHDSAEVLNLHGVDLEPYIEQIASGVSFELTDAEFNLSLTDSRKDSS